MTLRNSLVLTSLLGLGALAGKGQAQSPSAATTVMQPDSVVIAQTNYVVKPYTELTTVIPPGSTMALHGSFSSDTREVWMDKENYTIFLADSNSRRMVTKMTQRLNEDHTADKNDVTTTGFFVMYKMSSNLSSGMTSNCVMQMTGWEGRSAENKQFLSHAIHTNKHDMDAYQAATGTVKHLSLYNAQFRLLDGNQSASIDKARAGTSPGSHP